MNNTKERMCGNWFELLIKLGVDATLLLGKNKPCPLCGGKDRFTFSDLDGSGSYYCRKCDPGDGFELVRKLQGFDSFKRTADLIDEAMGFNSEPMSEKRLKSRINGNEMKKFLREYQEEKKQQKTGVTLIK